MSFAGHVFDMISRSKQNLAMIKSRQEKIRRIRNEYIKSNAYKTHSANKKHIPPELLNEIKSDIRKKLQKENRRYWYFSTFTLLTIVGVVLYFLLEYF